MFVIWTVPQRVDQFFAFCTGLGALSNIHFGADILGFIRLDRLSGPKKWFLDNQCKKTCTVSMISFAKSFPWVANMISSHHAPAYTHYLVETMLFLSLLPPIVINGASLSLINVVPQCPNGSMKN